MTSTYSLTVYCGPMFAGKSTALLNAYKAIPDGKAILLKPDIDSRYGEDRVATHDGMYCYATSLKEMIHISDEIEHVFFDEMQFLEEPWFHGDMLEIVQSLLQRKKSVYAAGLDNDAWGNPFQVSSTLLALADTVYKLKAVCHECGAPANSTVLRASSHGERIILGGSDKYDATCREHWKRPD